MDEALNRKLRILADAAKYDASCASAGAKKRKASPGGIGSTDGNGICHAYTPDGRCVSLLKILLTNYCLYDCAYCINRWSSNVERARFKVDVGRVCARLKRVRPFIVAADWRPTAETDRVDLRERLAPQPMQMSLF